ncbi:MAG TPA: hypothetical protein VF116_20990 [Ktedonobacterales bacterium]
MPVIAWTSACVKRPACPVLTSDVQRMDLAATAAIENHHARFNRAFAVEAQGFYNPSSWRVVVW